MEKNNQLERLVHLYDLDPKKARVIDVIVENVKRGFDIVPENIEAAIKELEKQKRYIEAGQIAEKYGNNMRAQEFYDKDNEEAKREGSLTKKRRDEAKVAIMRRKLVYRVKEMSLRNELLTRKQLIKKYGYPECMDKNLYIKTVDKVIKDYKKFGDNLVG